ncbi:fimbrial protein [Gardnerella vaginalis]|uniref:Fimbrial protein n=1 Tax=Gardnerella vaginalis TaxID=2702 RepID=A0A3E1J205_GARVA|nr:SpaH/EbpB family LPXTG-anchored major pilin [Gardnerella vaginalis]RFD80389.1 fimbrial protein [Gardnerella vaginalis]
MRLNKILLKRAVAAFAAACTLGTCCIAGSVAWAKDDATAEANTANINPDTAVSLSIHKYQGTQGITNSGGSEIKKPAEDNTLKDKKPVEGVEFTLYKVQKDGQDIDLSKSAGWKEISVINDKANPSDYLKKDDKDTTKGHVFTKTKLASGKTNAAGLVKFVKTASDPAVSGEVAAADLAQSLYLVEETDTDGAKIDGAHVTVTGRVDPFFVTLPLANSTTNTWIYDVHVYPKNDTTNQVPTKTASDPTRMDIVADSGENKTDGTRITWKIAIPLPSPAKGQAYDAIGFSDKLAKGLTFDKVQNVQLVKYTTDGKPVTTGTGNTEKLENTTTDTYYTVTPPPEGNKQVLTFDLTKTGTNNGLAKAYTFYSAAKKDGQIAKLEAEVVTKVGKDVTDVKNIANTWADNNKTGNKDNPCDPGTAHTEDTDPCKTAPSDTSYYGTLKVTKQDKDNNQPLDGAKFDVYEITGNTKKDAVKSVENSSGIYSFKGDKGAAITSTKVGSSLETKKKTEGTTTTHGTDSVKLFVRKQSDKNTTSKTYCIVETDAPAGYDLYTKPVCYDLVEDSATTANTANTQTVKDMKSTPMSKIVGALPMTGARGLVILTLCGIIGIAGTFFYIVLKRRKEQEQA